MINLPSIFRERSLFNDFPFLQSSTFPSAPKLALQVKDVGNAFEISVDMPGITKDIIEVEVDGDFVTVGYDLSKSEEKKDESGTVIYSEKRKESARRTFQLPQAVSLADSKAVYEEGVLKLSLVKQNKPQEKRLTIE